MEADLGYYKGLVIGHERNERQLENQIELLTYRAVQAEQKADRLNTFNLYAVGFACVLLSLHLLGLWKWAKASCPTLGPVLY